MKQPDIVMRTVARAIDWVRTNLKLCIAGMSAALFIFLCVFAYSLYAAKQDDKAQYLLSKGMQAFAEYTASSNGEALRRAEDAFNKVVAADRSGTRSAAKLYLGRIYYMQGKIEEAKKIYREVQNESSEPVFKTLSTNALNAIEKK